MNSMPGQNGLSLCRTAQRLHDIKSEVRNIVQTPA